MWECKLRGLGTDNVYGQFVACWDLWLVIKRSVWSFFVNVCIFLVWEGSEIRVYRGKICVLGPHICCVCMWEMLMGRFWLISLMSVDIIWRGLGALHVFESWCLHIK